MTVENKIELYVFENEYKEVVGIYETIELDEFYNLYTTRVIESAEEHYCLDERLKYHMVNFGYLAKFYDIYPTIDENDSELKDYLKTYNEVTQEKLSFEKIEVLEEDEQVIINYIFKNGLDKYKKNKDKTKNLIPSIEILWNKQDEKPIVLKEYTCNVEKLVECILTSEMSRIYQEHSTEELLFEKTNYLKNLIRFVDELNEVLNDKVETLYKLQEVYNNEFYFCDNEIIVNEY
ncbi:hypothetical protein [Staphylococcus saprophyticus]|jgi:hypothetical protein|uniref:hypothetical protein n=1 Tax=Staphylococcus saprophyticus TaxID=29385 RepID=UPI001642E190|nr:hypothetical protein [Staphylococcus saprophyticus]MBC2921940.1 hypothetical protein [Staphylococcus saprophyticus]MBC2958537.1 hypothetical protein [Staphylococcus saprophyticus]MBC3010380.1 hypothetical protein [Staphylococcus saprophyticus]MBC3024259.1 hypothetical protein [Staphylococcus saprophyticus]MBC3031486.1 hypothetical protein [Staphylococcus saprophyticus]